MRGCGGGVLGVPPTPCSTVLVSAAAAVVAACDVTTVRRWSWLLGLGDVAMRGALCLWYSRWCESVLALRRTDVLLCASCFTEEESANNNNRLRIN